MSTARERLRCECASVQSLRSKVVNLEKQITVFSDNATRQKLVHKKLVESSRKRENEFELVNKTIFTLQTANATLLAEQTRLVKLIAQLHSSARAFEEQHAYKVLTHDTCVQTSAFKTTGESLVQTCSIHTRDQSVSMHALMHIEQCTHIEISNFVDPLLTFLFTCSGCESVGNISHTLFPCGHGGCQNCIDVLYSISGFECLACGNGLPVTRICPNIPLMRLQKLLTK